MAGKQGVKPPDLCVTLAGRGAYIKDTGLANLRVSKFDDSIACMLTMSPLAAAKHECDDEEESRKPTSGKHVQES